jgi:hypothetical protein
VYKWQARPGFFLRVLTGAPDDKWGTLLQVLDEGTVQDPGPDEVVLSTDSEWDARVGWLSTAFYFEGRAVVFIRIGIPARHVDRLKRAADGLDAQVAFLERADATCLLPRALDLLGIRPKVVRLLMFFSPKDVEYSVGWEWFQRAILDKKVRQRNNLSGRIDLPGEVKVYLKDLCGWAGKKSLLTFAQSLGLDAGAKDLLDDYKTRMLDALTERPEDFLRYAVNDAAILPRLHKAFLDHFRSLQQECLHMSEEDLWGEENIPMTGGSLIARTLEKWIYGQAPEPNLMRFCVRKLGILDPSDPKHDPRRRLYRRLCDRYRDPGRLRRALAGPVPKDLQIFLRMRFLHTGLDACGVRWWAGRPVTESACFLGLVHGGRCANEDPFSYTMGPGLDIDISGCYGSSLRSTVFPVGLPTQWSFSPNQERPTFGRWLDENLERLEEGLWSCSVSGRLDFEQDLIHSKLCKAEDVKKAAGEEGHDIPANFILPRKEVRNGIITSDLLKALRRVATNKEWAGIRSLRLVCAAGYMRKDRVDTAGEWCARVLRDRGEYRCVGAGVEDGRTRAWLRVPLEAFVGQLQDRRQHYKDLARTATGEEERARATGMDALLKLAVNMTYGILSARFFSVGNTVIANNITARARLGVWMMAKALGLKQTITDGGAYEPGMVCFFGGHRPGLDALSRAWSWHAPCRGRWQGPLGGLDWSGGPGDWPEADELNRLALDHVRAFWEPYGLDFPFPVVEHKAPFTAAAFWSKGDYVFRLADGTRKYAVRGKDKTAKEGQHPMFELLGNALDGKDDFPGDMHYTHRGLLKVAKYQIIQASRGWEGLKHLRPGDDYEEKRVARFNNLFFPVADEAEWRRRRDRKKVVRGRPVLWFERYGPGGIDCVHRHMSQDLLR